MKAQILFIFVLMTGALNAQQLPIESPLRFLALGDSYTIGERVDEAQAWPNQLADSLSRRGIQVKETRIIAQTGWRTDNLQAAIEAQQPDSGYQLVSLLIGVNDQYQGIAVNQYPDNFESLLQQAIALAGGQTQRVFVLSIPDYAYTPFGQNLNPSQITSELNEYNAINESISKEYGVIYIGITDISRQGLSQPALVASDGLHPSGQMYRLWVERILHIADLQTTAAPLLGTRAQLDVYPVPVTRILSLQLPDKLVKTPKEIRVWNPQGQLVFQRQYAAGNSHRLSWPVSNWPNGVYLIQLISNGQVYTSRFIKQ